MEDALSTGIMTSDAPYIVVGAGVTGCVFAERIANILGKKVVVIERRTKIGGNASATIDKETGIELHDYGSHIFHTSNPIVWSYINRFTSFNNYRHHVLFTAEDGHVYFMPINLKTIQEFTGRTMSPSEMILWMKSQQIKLTHEPENLEEKAISLMGRKLYETFVHGYTEKQWGRKAVEIQPEILSRLPVRTSFNTEYFEAQWQGIPAEGYQHMFERMLSHPKIEIHLHTDFANVRNLFPKNCRIIYTGALDEYFGYSLGTLEWRSLKFENEWLDLEDAQGTGVMNYGSLSIPYTRIHEFKHYHPEWRQAYSCPRTIICREFPQTWHPGLEAFYPIDSLQNRRLLDEYRKMAKKEEDVIFCGRLASVQYWDMDKAIAAALDCFETQIAGYQQKEAC